MPRDQLVDRHAVDHQPLDVAVLDDHPAQAHVAEPRAVERDVLEDAVGERRVAHRDARGVDVLPTRTGEARVGDRAVLEVHVGELRSLEVDVDEPRVGEPHVAKLGALPIDVHESRRVRHRMLLSRAVVGLLQRDASMLARPRRKGSLGAALHAPSPCTMMHCVDEARARDALSRLPVALGLVVEEVLGAGAFGVVFAAHRQSADGRREPRALKVIDRLGAADHARAEAMLRSVAAIDHPGLLRVEPRIVQLAEASVVVMERLVGAPLLDHLRPPAPAEVALRPTLPQAFGQPVQEGGRSAFTALPAARMPELRRCFGALAGALCALHQRGWIHRDVQPANVRVEPNGRVVLLDFGNLRAPGAHAELAGAPAYMAPEQADGASPACDWYAFGVLLFEALTAALPFAGSAQDVLVRKHTVSAPAPSLLVDGVPSDLDDLVVRLLRRGPSLRAGIDEVTAVLGRG